MPHFTTKMPSFPPDNIGFVGLGAMGFGMASHLVKSGYNVHGFDVVPSQVAAFEKLGGRAAKSPKAAAADSKVLIVVVASCAQADTVFFDPQNGAVESLPRDATIVLCATVPPSYYGLLKQRLNSVGRQDICLLDAPISGGAVKAGLGKLTILTAGSEAARKKDAGVVAMLAEKVYHIPGELGAASTVKMINQLLAGVHIAAAAEAMALAARMHLNTQKVFDAVNASLGWSWMFENRAEHMLRDDWTPKSALDIFVKDMGIVTSTARSLGFPTPMSVVAEQLYISASSAGLGREDDAGIVRTYLPADSPSLVRDLTGVEPAEDVEMKTATIIELLKGIHLVAAAEALALAVRCGIDTRSAYDIISNAAGTSRIFESRGPEMVEHEFNSSKTLGETNQKLAAAIDEAKRFNAPVYLASSALQICQHGALAGLSQRSDSAIVEVWDSLRLDSFPTNISKEEPPFEPREYPEIQVKLAEARLPREYSKNVLPEIHEKLGDSKIPTLVVLDDDPTGTQTCHGINVLTTWTIDALAEELSSGAKGFFVLTNSRALGPDEARDLITEICENLKEASKRAKFDYEVVLRGDSTLRGHFPLEVEVAAAATFKPDGWILAPFFFQGGRYTIDDVHYVLEGTELVPAGKTQFAEDRTFGYRSSNLRDYVREKAGAEKAKTCVSISIADVRVGGPERVASVLSGVSNESVVIVNAAAESDMHVFCLGLLLARAAGKSFLYRTGAAFVSSRLGIDQIAPLSPADVAESYESSKVGGLIVAGSYVPKTTKQLDALRKRRGDSLLCTITLDIKSLTSNPVRFSDICAAAAEKASSTLRSGKDVLIMSSRELVAGVDGAASLSIGALVAKTLVEIVEKISVRPRYFIAKGGITSSDAATKSLRIKKAAIVGQGAAGCPLWRSDEAGSRWPGIPFLVFPGNVGGEETLGEVVERWALPEPR